MAALSIFLKFGKKKLSAFIYANAENSSDIADVSSIFVFKIFAI
jgi:hypothetical protein